MGVEDQDTASPDVSADDTLDDVVASPVLADADSDSADSSPAPAKDEKSALSIVRDAVDPKKAAPDPSTGESDHQAAPKPSKEPDDENFSDVPFHQHPRFRALIQQRNDLRAPAESYKKVQSYLTENAISDQEASSALQWVALMKQDPEKAWETIKPTIQELLTAIGQIIPQDLREQVAAGRLAPDVAKALAKERAKATVVQRQMSFRDQQTEAQRRQQEADAMTAKQTAVRQATREWEAAIRGKDPDFAKKERRLRGEVLQLLREEGAPDTPEGVKAQLDKALKAVNSEFAAARPRRPEVRPVTGGSTSGTPRAKPKNVLEIIQNVGAH